MLLRVDRLRHPLIGPQHGPISDLGGDGVALGQGWSQPVGAGDDEVHDGLTLTTDGYGDVIPMTAEGRVAAAVLMLLGITLLAGITGTITSWFVQDEEGSGADVAERLRTAAALHDEGALTEDEYQANKAELLPRL